MAETASLAMTGKPLIESDRVEGTTVYMILGSIKRLMIEKISGRVAYAVMSFGVAGNAQTTIRARKAGACAGSYFAS